MYTTETHFKYFTENYQKCHRNFRMLCPKRRMRHCYYCLSI